MGVGARFDPRVIAVPVGVVGDLLDELVSALARVYAINNSSAVRYCAYSLRKNEN